MNEQQFAALAALGYNKIPLTPETFADLDTPLSIYLRGRLLDKALQRTGCAGR